MQFKTSCCNKTLLKKDLTRFAPLWGVYTLGLLLWLTLSWNRQQEAYFSASNFVALFPGLIVVNLGYGALAAVLFGDLYNTRMCYGTHALPMTRGCWFGTHILSGLLFSLVPTAVLAAVSLPLLASAPVPNGWQLSIYWFLSTNLEYLIFFGIAVFSAMCAGNWLGLAAIYGLINFGSMIVCLLVEKLFTPLLFGVVTPRQPFETLSPLYNLAGKTLIVMHPDSAAKPDGTMEYFGTFTLGDGWSSLVVLALVGVAFLVVACLLYRRRNLETAGDFLAMDILKPIMGVCLALTGAGFALLVVAVFDFGNYTNTDRMFYALVGLAVGWFAGQMFLERTTRVFGPKKWAGLLVMLALAAGAMGLTKLDPLGIDDWVPEVSEIRGASINSIYYVDTPEELAQVIQIQELALQEHLTEEDVAPYLATDDANQPKFARLQIVYTKSNGMGAIREYYVASDSQAGDLLRSLTSKLPFVFRRDDITSPQKLMTYVGKPYSISVFGHKLPEELLTEETVRSLFEAVIADCEAGTISPISALHPTKVCQTEDGDNLYLDSMWVEAALPTDEEGTYRFYNISFFPDSENMLAWAQSVGITWDVIAEGVYG